MYGLCEETLKEMNTAFVHIPQIRQVMLYGSRAKGNYRHGSDIDIVLLGEHLTLENSVYPLMDVFEDSYLPYTFDISILQHIDDHALLAHIERVAKVLYVKGATQTNKKACVDDKR